MESPTIVVGRITKAHGLKGELAVDVRSDNPDRFVATAKLFLEDGRTLTVERVRRHGPRLLLTFAEAKDRASAERLQGELLLSLNHGFPFCRRVSTGRSSSRAVPSLLSRAARLGPWPMCPQSGQRPWRGRETSAWRR